MSSSSLWLSCASITPGEVQVLAELVQIDSSSFAYTLDPDGVVRIRVPDLATAAWLIERLGWLRAAQKALEYVFRLPAVPGSTGF